MKKQIWIMKCLWEIITVNGDVSMEQNVDIKRDLHVNEKANMDDDVFREMIYL